MKSKKIKRTFTLDVDVYKKFSELADSLAINKSKFIENKLIEFINNGK